MNVTIHFFTYRWYYRHIFCKSTAIICQLTWLHFSKINFCDIRAMVFVTIICDHVWWSLTGNRKQKNMSNFWPKSGHGRLRNLRSGLLWESIWNSVWLRNKTKQQQNSLFVKWSLTKGGHLREVVPMRELTVCL